VHEGESYEQIAEGIAARYPHLDIGAILGIMAEEYALLHIFDAGRTAEPVVFEATIERIARELRDDPHAAPPHPFGTYPEPPAAEH